MRPSLATLEFFKILEFIKKDLLRHARDPVALLLWAAIPLAVAILMKAAFGGDDQVPQASLVIADQDGSFVSQILGGAFGQGPLAELITVEEADSAQAVRLAQEGKVSAALIIPRGFGEAYLAGESASLTLLRNPSQSILPGIVEEAIAVLADGGFYLRELLGEPIATIRKLAEVDADVGTDADSAPTGTAPPSATAAATISTAAPPSATAAATISTTAPPSATAATSRAATPSPGATAAATSTDGAELAMSIQRPFQRIGPYLFPPVLAIAAPAGAGTEPSPRASFLALFFPGIITMSMLFLGQALAVDVWAEHKLGTFRRLLVSPRGAGGVVLGKVMTSTLVLWLVFEILLVAGRYAFGIELERIHLAAFYSAICGFGVMAALHLVMVLARTENGGTMLASLIVMPLVFLGGSFFPFETLSPTLRAVGMATPNGQILVQMKHILFGDPVGLRVWLTAAASVGLGLVFVGLAGRMARRRFLGAS